ncbi:MAG: SMP-30/gluconolactonase/LRE family protein [Chloroflexia bacterium]
MAGIGPPGSWLKKYSGAHNATHANVEPGLPVVDTPPDAELPRISPGRKWVAFCFGLTLLLYVALIPNFLRFSNPPTGDQPFYLMDTMSIVQDGDLNVANNYAQHDEDKFYKLAPRPEPFAGESAPYPLPPQLAVTRRPPGEQYDHHQPGLGALLVPAWIVGSWFSLWWPATIVFMCIVGALVGVNIFLLAYELTGRLIIAWAVWLPLTFSSPIMSYSFLIFTELPTGLLLIYAFRRLAHGWRGNRPWQLVLAGAAIGYIPWLAWRCAPIAAGLGVYACVQWWRSSNFGFWILDFGLEANPKSKIQNPKSLLWLLIPIAISILLMVGYDLFLFGSLTPNTAAGPGVESPVFYWPWGGSEARTAFVNDAFALLFDQQWGLLPHAPVYVLAPVGMIAMWRRGRSGGGERRLLGWIALVALPYFTLIAAFNFWNGLWCPPARYLTTLVPLLAGPLAVSLAALGWSWIYRLLYLLLALPGWAYMALVMTDPRLMFPASQGFFWSWLAQSPDLPFHPNLRRVLPTFAWPDLTRQPLTTGWIIASALLVTLCGDLLMSLRRASPWQARSQRVRGLGWLAAIVLVGAGWLTINAEYLKHRSVLHEQARWNINRPLDQPLGIAYLDGRIYLVDYRGGAAGTLDTRTGAFEVLTPQGADGPLSYTHPGDVKVGPDGLLYVLNNGAGDTALLVMRPNGEVVRQVPLNEKSDVAVGLGFGPGGKLYVGDMVGARVREYEAGGGAPVRNLTDDKDGFDNLAGVTVTPDGRIYAADVSKKQVVRVSEDGHFTERYNLHCSPWYIAPSGDWLDVSCDRGLVSINTRTGNLQDSLVEENKPALASPTGLAYGPDGLLYVLDRAALVAYRVER